MAPTSRLVVPLAVALIALSLAAPAEAQRRRGGKRPIAGATPDRGGNGDGSASPCLSDQFFVHVPTFASPAALPASFRGDLKAAMTAYIASRGALGGITVDVAPTLVARAAITQRADGHRRFWRVQTNRDIPAAELCGWLHQLRTRAAALGGATIYVGRECVAGALADAGSPDWPVEVMGEPGAVAGVPAPVAIVDSGFKATPDWAAASATGAPHPHGAMIEGLIKQVTGRSTTPALLDYRVLDSTGSAPLADVAAALDAAVFEARGDRVINLSLGWPPELERRRTIDGCAEVEDPAGEAVRYAVAMAALRDEGRLTGGPGVEGLDGAMAVVAAAGNRPELYGADVTPYYATHYRVDRTPLAGDCSQPSGDGMFYPAQWARRRTCLGLASGNVDVAPRLLPVGATDHRDARSPLSSQEMTPLLVAPGVSVRTGGYRWSGSSISAAFASTAVALELAGGGSGHDAAQAVIARAVPLPAIRSRLVPKRLRFARTRPAKAPIYVTSGGTISGSGTAPITGPARAACMVALQRWMAGTATQAAVRAACPAFLTSLDRFSAGAAGPQPLTTGCPECFIGMDPTAGRGDLHVTLTGDWVGATFADPYLVINWPDGYESWIALPGGASWAPTSAFTIANIPIEHPQKTSTMSDLMSKGSMSVVMQVTWYGKTSTDVSVVTMKP